MEQLATIKLVPGMDAPDFTLPDSTGKEHSLSEYRGQNVIVYFYPQAATPGCTTQACDFRDSLESFTAAGFTVLGVSPDSEAELAAFSHAHELSFPLLADQDARVAREFGAWGEKLVDGEVVDGLVRSTVVVDPDGKVRAARYQVAAAGHVAALKEALGI